MSKAKIYCLVTNDLSYDQRMIRICTALQENGYQITLVGRILTDSKALTKHAFRQKRLSCFFNKGKLFYLEYNLRLFFFLLFRPWDAVNAIDLDTLLAATAVAKIKGNKIIYDAHEYFTEVPELAGRKRSKAIWEWLAKTCIPRADACYTVGEALRQILEQRYQKTFALVRNLPSYKAQSSFPEKDTAKIILYQGALNKGRGIETAIKAIKMLPDCQLWLAGEGDLSQSLRALSSSQNTQTQVKFLGKIDPSQLQAITAKAWIGLNLLENNSLNYYYSLANKFFDYMQAAVPSINMNFPEYQALISKYPTGLLLEELSPESLASAIQKLMQNPSEYEALVQASLEAKERYHWEAEQANLLAVYNALFDK